MKRKKYLLEKILVTGYAAEGKSLARQDGKVIFIEGAVPGDLVDVFITTNKKDYGEGKVTHFHEYSKERTNPFCQHFGICGGCKWQMLPYQKQLEYKQQEVAQNFRRIGKVTLPPMMPIVGSDDTKLYRNKLEFTFSTKEYTIDPPARDHSAPGSMLPAASLLQTDNIDSLAAQADTNIAPLSNEVEKKGDICLNIDNSPQPIPPGDHLLQNKGALGYHVPRLFDKIIDIQECYLMDDINNAIRNNIRVFALENNCSYYDIKHHTGWLRNIIIRYCTTGELMVNICLGYEDEAGTKKLLDFLLLKVPSITTLLYTINTKWNDTISDLSPVVYFGKGYVLEKLGEFSFRIGPKSFFQTNTRQAEKLYTIARDFAGLTGNEIVYDLYCGTGSIGIFLSRLAKKIIGVDVVTEAIDDAKINAAINQVEHAGFYAGDVINICNNEFFSVHGRPDVIITDPPRAGMHEKLVNKLLEIESPKIVYISCNTATQARDLGLLGEKYMVEKIQPLDMFPHTHHIECVVLLILRKEGEK